MRTSSMVQLGIFATLLCTAAAAEARVVNFSGYTWWVKNSTGLVGPGPNYFSNSTDNVWVDGSGRLHLKITYDSASHHWKSAEMWALNSLGYGTYRFTLETEVDNLDPSAVLGLFTYLDDNHEIDIEFSKWGWAPETNTGGYSCQPYTIKGNTTTFPMSSAAHSVHSFNWTPSRIDYQSTDGTNTISSWSYTGASIPPHRSPDFLELAHMNLWLSGGAAPQNGQPVEVIISSFQFTPAP